MMRVTCSCGHEEDEPPSWTKELNAHSHHQAGLVVREIGDRPRQHRVHTGLERLQFLGLKQWKRMKT
jgi:hypothetical protein